MFYLFFYFFIFLFFRNAQQRPLVAEYDVEECLQWPGGSDSVTLFIYLFIYLFIKIENTDHQQITGKLNIGKVSLIKVLPLS